MQREDLVGGIGAITSVIVAFFSMGIVQNAFSYLAGAFTTYFIQHRLRIESEKRRIAREHGILMRDKVYGPLFQAMNQALELLEDIKSSDLGTYDKRTEDIKKIMEHYLFGLSEEELRKKVPQIYDDLVEYREARSKAVSIIHNIVKKKSIDTYGTSVNPHSIIFVLKDHEWPVEYVNIIEAVLKRINPLKSFKERIDLENPTIEVHVSGITQKDSKKVDELFKEVEQLAWKENSVIICERKRKKIIEDLKEIIPKLEKRIVA